MSMNFAKNARAVAFNPTSAFPLDARSYFESLAAAQDAAAKAVEVGSTSGVYYFGQTLTVVENNVASFYIIQPDGSLTPVSNDSDEPIKVEIDENQFAYTEDNKLVLKGAADASEGQVLAMSASGALAWVTPVDAYSKSETDTLIDTKIAAVDHLKRKIVGSVEEIEAVKDDSGADQYIYMVERAEGSDGDHYDEYMIVEIAGVKLVEKVGDWQVDLSGYATKTDLESYVAKEDGKRLLTAEEAAKIAESEKNYINDVDENQMSVDENRKLTITKVTIGTVSGLQDALNEKVDAKEGYSLISKSDQEKLSKLVMDEDGNVGLSGTINADNVEELDEWITKNRDSVAGLISEADQTKLDNLFDQVDPQSFTIETVEGGKSQLNLNTITIGKVENLEDELNGKASQEDLEELEALLGTASTDAAAATGLFKTVEDIASDLNNYVTMTTYTEGMTELKDILTWKEL